MLHSTRSVNTDDIAARVDSRGNRQLCAREINRREGPTGHHEGMGQAIEVTPDDIATIVVSVSIRVTGAGEIDRGEDAATQHKAVRDHVHGVISHDIALTVDSKGTSPGDFNGGKGTAAQQIAKAPNVSPAPGTSIDVKVAPRTGTVLAPRTTAKTTRMNFGICFLLF